MAPTQSALRTGYELGHALLYSSLPLYHRVRADRHLIYHIYRSEAFRFALCTLKQFLPSNLLDVSLLHLDRFIFELQLQRYARTSGAWELLDAFPLHATKQSIWNLVVRLTERLRT